MINSATSENKKAKLRAKYGLKEVKNPLFSLAVDLYRYVHSKDLIRGAGGPYFPSQRGKCS